jgi:hypothetical protein
MLRPIEESTMFSIQTVVVIGGCVTFAYQYFPVLWPLLGALSCGALAGVLWPRCAAWLCGGANWLISCAILYYWARAARLHKAGSPSLPLT